MQQLYHKIVNYIYENYSEPLLTNQMITDFFRYHPCYLGKIFITVKAKTLYQYIEAYRIKVAKELLITTDFDINSMAWKVGYNSTYYFIKWFSHQAGITTKAYKTKNIIDVL